MMIPAIPRNQTRHFPGQAFVLARWLLFPPPETVVDEFERAIAARFGVTDAITFSSARSACRAALDALDYPAGSIILMPSLNYPAIPRTVHESGYRVLWVPLRRSDLGPDFNALDSSALKEASALVWPHYFGFPGPMDSLTEFCDEFDIDLIEDCAHAIGAKYNDRAAGSFGRVAFVSFETSKMLNAFGGGAALTSDPRLAARLKKMRDNLPPRPAAAIVKGIIKSYAEALLTSRWVFSFTLFPAISAMKARGKSDFLVEGLKKPAPRAVERFSSVQAAAGLRQIRRLDRNLEQLQGQWTRIHDCLANAGIAVSLHPGARPNGYMTAGVSGESSRIAADFLRRGVDVKRNYMQDCQELDFGIGARKCPSVASDLFHLPVRTDLSRRTMAQYGSVIKDVLKNIQDEAN